MTVTSKKSPWVNNDGLPVYFAQDRADPARGGERDYDGRHETFLYITLAELETVSSGYEQIQHETLTIPAGAFIEDVEVFVTKEPTDAGGNANLDLGLVKAVDRTTEIDFNGFLAAADAFNSGTDLGRYTKYNLSTTEAGALIGTKLAYTGLITASAETADFTGGIIEVRIHWFVPLSTDV